MKRHYFVLNFAEILDFKRTCMGAGLGSFAFIATLISSETTLLFF